MDLYNILVDISKYLRVPGILVSLIFLVRIIKPVSFISAGIIEQRMFSKDKLFLLRVSKHLIYTFYCILFFISIATLEFEPSLCIVYSSILLGVIILCTIILINTGEVKGKILEKIQKKHWLRALHIILLFIFIILVFQSLYYILLAVIKKGTYNDMDLIILIIMIFVFTSLLPSLRGQISKFMNISNEKNAYWRCQKYQKWYLLHAINKDTVLLGDKSNYKLCSQVKIMKLEDLYNETLYIE
ncbi:hypothetical protein LG951_13280 [Bacillus pumilus]|uniref:hypothetical protein n=1 Tax=Bacillus pumilus TaxID=1408 RepID=UPI001D02B103|nr:hypothetical protein [Bacillus pumilus]UDF15459.1 hypothetical protein LG951_13280 [Bacillus pumilus]